MRKNFCSRVKGKTQPWHRCKQKLFRSIVIGLVIANRRTAQFCELHFSTPKLELNVQHLLQQFYSSPFNRFLNQQLWDIFATDFNEAQRWTEKWIFILRKKYFVLLKLKAESFSRSKFSLSPHKHTEARPRCAGKFSWMKSFSVVYKRAKVSRSLQVVNLFVQFFLFTTRRHKTLEIPCAIL